MKRRAMAAADTKKGPLKSDPLVIRTESNLKTTINLTLVDESDFNAEKLAKYFDKDYFFVKLSPINPNSISEKNNLGNGIIEGVNIV